MGGVLAKPWHVWGDEPCFAMSEVLARIWSVCGVSMSLKCLRCNQSFEMFEVLANLWNGWGVSKALKCLSCCHCFETFEVLAWVWNVLSVSMAFKCLRCQKKVRSHFGSSYSGLYHGITSYSVLAFPCNAEHFASSCNAEQLASITLPVLCFSSV